MYSPIRQSRLYEKIVAQIQERFMRGELKSGDRLPSERELAEQFGVSRTAVREAVKALREKGLVEILPGKGTFIANIADSTAGVVRDSLDLMVGSRFDGGLADLLQVRAILEPEIAAIAAAMADEGDFQALQEAVDTMDIAQDNPEAYIDADLRFHLALARATQNSLIPILIDPVVDLLREQRIRISHFRNRAVRGQHYHKRILKAVRQRDPNAARQAMADHLEQVEEDSGFAAPLKD